MPAPHGEDHHSLEDYEGGVPRWCNGCGDNAILAAVQRLCRGEDLSLEHTVFVSGIGCSSRFPHYMGTTDSTESTGARSRSRRGSRWRALTSTCSSNTGDGDCCSIGAAHWVHAVRYNMNLTVLLHDNFVYGLTKKQASPTSPKGLRSNTTPRGSYLDPLNPLSVTLGIQSASFVAQAVDWIPQVLYDIIAAAHRHRGFSFVRVIQRCPEFMPGMLDPWLQDPSKTLILTHEDGLQLSPELSRIYTNHREHDPLDIDAARRLASADDVIPVGILYRNPEVPCYEDLRGAGQARPADRIRARLEAELDKFTVWPAGDERAAA